MQDLTCAQLKGIPLQKEVSSSSICFSKGASKAAFLCAQESLLSQGFPSSHSKGNSTEVKLRQGEVIPPALLLNDQLLSARH